jgi:hypothetical protein
MDSIVLADGCPPSAAGIKQLEAKCKNGGLLFSTTLRIEDSEQLPL